MALLLSTSLANWRIRRRKPSAATASLPGIEIKRWSDIVPEQVASSGSTFQGRYKALLVDREAHLLELARNVVLNPVRAAMVADAADWPWSSYAATAGTAAAPDWLDVDALLRAFGPQRREAVQRYVQHVRAGVGLPSVWAGLKHQLYLGEDAFRCATPTHC